MTEKEERCIECDEPTGRAGQDDDSLYTNDLRGPYCEACYGKFTTEKEEQGIR